MTKFDQISPEMIKYDATSLKWTKHNLYQVWFLELTYPNLNQTWSKAVKWLWANLASYDQISLEIIKSNMN